MPSPLKNLDRLWRRHIRNPLRVRWRGWRYRAMPIAMVTGSKGKSTTTRLVASILREMGHVVGAATTDDARIWRRDNPGRRRGRCDGRGLSC